MNVCPSLEYLSTGGQVFLLKRAWGLIFFCSRVRILPLTARNMPKRTHQPKTKRRARKHGFMSRMRTKDGQNVLRRRRQRGRAQIAV